MADKTEKQKTPEGLSIPVPKRKDFFSNLRKVASKPKRESAPARGKPKDEAE